MIDQVDTGGFWNRNSTQCRYGFHRCLKQALRAIRPENSGVGAEAKADCQVGHSIKNFYLAGFSLACVGFEKFNLLHQLANFLHRISLARTAEPKEFNDVQTTLAQFQASNKAAFPSQFCRQLALRQASFSPKGNQQVVNAFALPGMNGFVHARILRALSACFQNAGEQSYRRDGNVVAPAFQPMGLHFSSHCSLDCLSPPSWPRVFVRRQCAHGYGSTESKNVAGAVRLPRRRFEEARA